MQEVWILMSPVNAGAHENPRLWQMLHRIFKKHVEQQL